jgi:cell division protein FtsZ
LLEAGAIDGARGILINITGSVSLKLAEVNEASTIIQSAAHEDANIIFGAVQNEKMKEEVKITVIATGFKNDLPQRKERSVSSIHTAISSARTPGAYQSPPIVATRPAAPTVMRQATPVRENPTLATVTEAIRGTIEPDDLDVPAFIRKRGEVN